MSGQGDVTCGLRGTVKFPAMSNWVPLCANAPGRSRTNVPPDATTACPAVATAVTMASSFDAPCERSSRQRETTSSE